MGIPGKQSKLGEGEKEPDRSVRDSLLKVKLPKWKLDKIKQVAIRRKITLTDLISEIIGVFLGDYARNQTQEDDEKGKEPDP